MFYLYWKTTLIIKEDCYPAIRIIEETVYDYVSICFIYKIQDDEDAVGV